MSSVRGTVCGAPRDSAAGFIGCSRTVICLAFIIIFTGFGIFFLNGTALRFVAVLCVSAALIRRRAFTVTLEANIGKALTYFCARFSGNQFVFTNFSCIAELGGFAVNIIIATTLPADTDASQTLGENSAAFARFFLGYAVSAIAILIDLIAGWRTGWQSARAFASIAESASTFFGRGTGRSIGLFCYTSFWFSYRITVLLIGAVHVFHTLVGGAFHALAALPEIIYSFT